MPRRSGASARWVPALLRPPHGQILIRTKAGPSVWCVLRTGLCSVMLHPCLPGHVGTDRIGGVEEGAEGGRVACGRFLRSVLCSPACGQDLVTWPGLGVRGGHAGVPVSHGVHCLSPPGAHLPGTGGSASCTHGVPCLLLGWWAQGTLEGWPHCCGSRKCPFGVKRHLSPHSPPPGFSGCLMPGPHCRKLVSSWQRAGGAQEGPAHSPHPTSYSQEGLLSLASSPLMTSVLAFYCSG